MIMMTILGLCPQPLQTPILLRHFPIRSSAKIHTIIFQSRFRRTHTYYIYPYTYTYILTRLHIVEVSYAFCVPPPCRDYTIAFCRSTSCI